ncbi:hypothetical protein HDF24_03265 [Mucilaginibacter sp. X4EP1]|uniref:DUF4760 domain-containing protein n=1 Tax=Mucilaginibacter sp. X4EP1 TaxID=2723092 RepID=UPI0021692E23|nr:hypothetical protein [Mucilaginibacter sp. X4EP1]MCS3812045.1 hypothetical protein [Mucilaginibacter sp. X4EP1]
MTSETITLIANIALAVSAIIALTFGIVQVKTAARDRRERFTLEALRNFNTREFSELMNYVASHDIPPTHEEWQKLPAHEGIMVTQFAQEMESLGILVAERLINIELVDKTIGSLVSTAWHKYKVMIADSREKRPDPFLCEYFQWIAERIDERMRYAPRKPFYLK